MKSVTSFSHLFQRDVAVNYHDNYSVLRHVNQRSVDTHRSQKYRGGWGILVFWDLWPNYFLNCEEMKLSADKWEDVPECDKMQSVVFAVGPPVSNVSMSWDIDNTLNIRGQFHQNTWNRLDTSESQVHPSDHHFKSCQGKRNYKIWWKGLQPDNNWNTRHRGYSEWSCKKVEHCGSQEWEL